MRFLSSRAHLSLIVGSMFAVGLLANAAVRSPPTSRSTAWGLPAFRTTSATRPATLGSATSTRADQRFAYSAEVVRVIDGDTFEALVSVSPGVEIKTRVRLRGH
jgi:endonuclease YncB( thermonuclease family)